MDPQARIILLGGSNLARGISTIVEIARRMGADAQGGGGPVEFLIAKGHGRSYGKPSTVLGRGLPGIIECGLWDALDPRDQRPTFALITDIGNDVAYGTEVSDIAEWVGTCIERLAQARARIVMTALPMQSLRKLSPGRFKVARSILFPSNRFSLDEALGRCGELDERVRRLAGSHGARIMEHEGHWYGVDPIHIKHRHRVAAWTRIMGAWSDVAETRIQVRRSAPRWLRLRSLTPQRWSLLGSQRGRPQPAGRLADGSTISLY
jgi:hypothetical protein